MTSFSATHTDWRIVRAVRAVVRNWGYTDAETSALLGGPVHSWQCEYDANSHSWQCEDDWGRSYHPEQDEIRHLEESLRVIFQAEAVHGPAPTYDWSDTYPLIKTEAELQDLPDEAVLRDHNEVVWEKWGWERDVPGPWFTPGTENGSPARRVKLPAVVIWAPEAKA